MLLVHSTTGGWPACSMMVGRPSSSSRQSSVSSAPRHDGALAGRPIDPSISIQLAGVDGKRSEPPRQRHSTLPAPGGVAWCPARGWWRHTRAATFRSAPERSHPTPAKEGPARTHPAPTKEGTPERTAGPTRRPAPACSPVYTIGSGTAGRQPGHDGR